MFWVLVAVVVLAPLPFAAFSTYVYSWSWGLMACVVGGLLVAWSVRVALGWDQPAFGLKRFWPLVSLFAAVTVWATVQSMSFTPSEWHHPLWHSAADALGVTLEPAVSLDPYETVSALTRLLTYGGIFWLSLQYSRRVLRARQILCAVTYAGLAYAVYGLFVQFTGAQSIFWLPKFAYENDLTSTFVNRNSYATYAGLGLLCTTGLILVMISQSVGSALGGKERLIQLLENMGWREWSLLVSWISIMTALILTNSRAGFFSTVLGMIVLILVLALTRTVQARFAAAFGVACLVAVTVFFAIGGDQLGARLAQTTPTSIVASERPRVYNLTLSAVESAPVIGTGYGTFEEVFRFYRTSDITNFYLKAHNTYLENALELGIPAALLLFAVPGGFLVLTFLGLRKRRREAIYPCVGFAATVLVAAHSTVDFSLQIPAVTATYCLIMGAACAQSWSSQTPDDPW
jgi:O-antigen ligase